MAPELNAAAVPGPRGPVAAAPWPGPVRPRLARLGAVLAVAAALLVYALPLLLALPLAVAEATSAQAWQALWADGQTVPALRLSLSTALAATGLSLVFTVLLVTTLHGTVGWQRLSRSVPALLSVPHAAFGIGLAWLMAPAGWLARGLAPLAGWAEPPSWQTVNDPAGWALVAALVLKETPFLLFSVAALLARPEVAATLQREQAVARTLGYTPAAWWWRVGWLQWLPRLGWPLLAVAAYGMTVVDLALILGPGSPPTLAVLAWQHLGDGDPARNAQGAAAALLLAAALAAAVGAVALGWRGLHRLGRTLATAGRRPSKGPASRAATRIALGLGRTLPAVYAAVGLSLCVLAVAGPWPFPAAWPPVWSLGHGRQVIGSLGTVAFTAALGLGVSAAAVALVVAWFEAVPAAWDARVMPLVLAPLVLPQLLLLVGLYCGALMLRLDGSVWGLAWVHGLLVLPYTFTALAPAWRSFDHRYGWSALTVGRSRLAFWWHVKRPLLAAPLASALAIGFAVSVAQYLATQFIGAGRHATLSTEAVTLASGGQRNLAAAFGLLQALLPALAFGAAAWVGRRGVLR
jgi:putative thiamine transport system permease protein